MKFQPLRVPIILLLGLFMPVSAQVQNQENDLSQQSYRIVCPSVLTPTKQMEKSCAMAQDFLDKNPNADPYWKQSLLKIIKRCEKNSAYAQYDEAQKDFFTAPNTEKLNKLVATGEVWLEKSSSPDIGVTNSLALATGYSVLANIHGDTNRTSKFIEKALALLEQPTPPTGVQQKQWDDFRQGNIARLNQYFALCKLRQENPDPQGAIDLLTKVLASNDDSIYKDFNTYLLGAEANYLFFEKLNAEYKALPEDSGEERKLLAKSYPIIDKIIEDYARVVALTDNKNELQFIYHKTCQELDRWAVMRNKNAASIVNKYKQEFDIQ